MVIQLPFVSGSIAIHILIKNFVASCTWWCPRYAKEHVQVTCPKDLLSKVARLIRATFWLSQPRGHVAGIQADMVAYNTSSIAFYNRLTSTVQPATYEWHAEWLQETVVYSNIDFAV